MVLAQQCQPKHLRARACCRGGKKAGLGKVLIGTPAMLPDYAAIKHFHMSAAALSIALFILRGTWMLWSPQRLSARWVRILPHVIDTALLASALWLAWQFRASGGGGWLIAKLAGLLVYIALGTIALKRGPTRRIRAAAFVGAVAVVVYIVMVAVTKSPLGVFA